MFELSDFTITINSSLPEDIAFIECNRININEILNILNKDCNMDYIILCSNWEKQTYRRLDVRGLSNAEVCKKVYVFYKHKTYRRLMGDHIFLEGWFIPLPDEPNVFKPLMYGS
jgi:hypothetical protein